ncbi:MAG: tRNA epoxyqueuosine(34) reductase QueG [Pirellula sp.]|jgi:epoxyqueuosine reductase
MILQQLARQQLRDQAAELGFEVIGFVSAQPTTEFEHLRSWVEQGYAGSMEYIASRLDAYRHPEGVLPGCRSLVMLAIPYASHPRTIPSKSSRIGLDEAQTPSGTYRDPKTNALKTDPENRSTGTIASYASGTIDYHDWIHDRLRPLVASTQSMFPGMAARGVVDTAPLLERYFAARANLGWIGKNTLLLNRKLGSYFFLAAVLTQAELGSEESATEGAIEGHNDHCGSCTACLDACPTNAFVKPHVLDATRCISYWTIEHRGTIPQEKRQGIQDWLFGCDACQTVCPWNRKRSVTVPEPLRPSNWSQKTDPVFWLTLSDEEFRKRFRHTPFWRRRLVGMQRNAMIVAANTRNQGATQAILPFLDHPDPVLNELADWTLKQLQQA